MRLRMSLTTFPFIFAMWLATPAFAESYFFSTGNPDFRLGALSRLAGPQGIETETADDFVLTEATAINQATIIGGIVGSQSPLNISNVEVEIYHVFPEDSANPPSGNVPTRVNSPSDVEIATATRDSSKGTLSSTAKLLNAYGNSLVSNTVINGISKVPNQHTGGEGSALVAEVEIDITFTPPITLPAGHYFFRPEVLVNTGTFLYLSAPRPIAPPGTPFPSGSTDLQAWMRNSNLAPDWLRIGTDIVGGTTYNMTFSLTGNTIPEAGSMAQIASGGGWDTTLTLVNTGASAGEALLNFFGDDGSPLALPFTFPQGASPAVAATLDQILNANSLLVIDSQQPSNPTAQVGSAQLSTTGNVGGFAIFKYLPTGQEAVVPLETRNAPAYVLAFDNTGAVATGVAIANVTAQSANIPVVIRDDTGSQIGAGAISLAAQGHTSFLLAPNYPVTTGKRGTIEFDTPPSGQIAALGLRANSGALTTLPVLAQVTAGGGSMAQVASGGGWQTTFTLVNTGTSAAQAQLSFFDNNGSALSLPLTFVQSGTMATAPTISQTIAAGGTLAVLTQGNNAAATVAGSAQLTTTGNISGFAIYRYNPTGQEAVVPLETRNANAYILAFDNTNGIATGLALANVSNQAISVPVVLRDDTGASLGTATINLAALGHTAFILAESYASVAGKRGTVEFDTPTGAQISALGLRGTPSGAVTTIPVLAK